MRRAIDAFSPPRPAVRQWRAGPGHHRPDAAPTLPRRHGQSAGPGIADGRRRPPAWASRRSPTSAPSRTPPTTRATVPARGPSRPWPWPQRVGRGEAGERPARHRNKTMKSHPGWLFHRGNAASVEELGDHRRAQEGAGVGGHDTTTIFQPSLRKAGRSLRMDRPAIARITVVKGRKLTLHQRDDLLGVARRAAGGQPAPTARTRPAAWGSRAAAGRSAPPAPG